MLIEKSVNGNETVLHLSGRIDTTTAPDLREMLVCRKKLPGDRMRIVHARDEVYDRFPMLSNGKADMLSLKKDLTERVKALRRSRGGRS